MKINLNVFNFKDLGREREMKTVPASWHKLTGMSLYYGDGPKSLEIMLL